MGLKESGLRGSLRNVSVGIDAIPDSDIFQNPIYRYDYSSVGVSDETSPFDVPESLAGLNDATAEGSPIFREDQEGVAAGEYDGIDDGHNADSDSNTPTGTDAVSMAALVYVRSFDSNNCIYNYGPGSSGDTVNLNVRDDGRVLFRVNGGDFVTADSSTGLFETGQWVTVGGSLFSDGQDGEVFYNGDQVGATSGEDTPDLQNESHSIGYNRGDNDEYSDAFIADVIICDGREVESAYSEYHSEWMDILG